VSSQANRSNQATQLTAPWRNKLSMFPTTPCRGLSLSRWAYAGVSLPSTMNQSSASPHFLGLRTAIYHAPDLQKAKAWYSSVLGIKPYFDQPFYVGFSVGGFELGLDPHSAASGAGGVTVYWGVANASAALERLLSLGATQHAPVQDVGDGIRVATVLDPFGNVVGIIENPHFKLSLESNA